MLFFIKGELHVQNLSKIVVASILSTIARAL